MVHDPSLPDVLGVAGEFFAVDGDVVAAVDLGVDAQLGQRVHHRLAEEPEVEMLGVRRVGDKGEVQVAHVVIHGAAAGETAHHGDTVGIHVGLIDLRQGVLVFADDDGVVILPQHEISPVPGQTVKNHLLHGQIVSRIGGVKIQIGQLHGRLLR